MTRHILVVDDNEADHVIAQFALEDAGLDIVLHSAYDGQQALEMLDVLEPSPDIIFLDINMPGMNGHQFLSEYAKKQSHGSVVVMLTSSDQEVDKKRCMQYSFVRDYIIKPLESGYLVTLLEHL